MSSEPTNYSKYLVIFIDILGSKNRVDFQEAYTINKIFHEELLRNPQNDKLCTVYFRKIYTFSDCAYIFYGFKKKVEDERMDLGKLFTVALCNCEPIFLRFIKEKVVFRGGISYGDAYIDPHKSMFFGPAVSKAYEIEAKKAIHPRIVIDSYVGDKIVENIEQVKCELAAKKSLHTELWGENWMSLTGDGVVEKDVDGEYIFNYLHFPENNMIFRDYYLSGEDFIREIMKYCHEQIDQHQSYNIIDKYYYLLRFCQSKINNLEKRGISPTVIIPVPPAL